MLSSIALRVPWMAESVETYQCVHRSHFRSDHESCKPAYYVELVLVYVLWPSSSTLLEEGDMVETFSRQSSWLRRNAQACNVLTASFQMALD